MTRTDDEFVGLNERASKANSVDDPICLISIHQNSLDESEGSAAGLESWTYKREGCIELGDAVIEDGMFLACEDTVELEVTARKNVSSLILGGEGIWNTMLAGYGLVALESPVPADELIVVDLEDDIIKLDGSMAVAWSSTLKFTVEKTTSTLVGSLASGEGFVNVYTGTGRVLIAPVRENKGINAPKE